MAVVSNGTTIIDAGALGSGVATGKMILIKTLTASSSGTLSFVDGAASVVLDDTYDSYVFKFYDIHPANNDTSFAFQTDTGSNTSYNQTITSTFFNAQHSEGDANYLMYRTTGDLAQGTGFQRLTEGTGADNDQSCSGTLTIYNPSDTTFVKHFIANTHNAHHGDYAMNNFIAGYVNTTTALTRVQFKFESGAIASGTIKLYGIGG
jgi:hypothetical protein